MSSCQCTVVHILTHWGRVTHICVSKQPIIASDNGLSPGRRQATVGTNAGILYSNLRNKFQWNLKRNSIIFIKKKMCFKVSSAEWRPFCLHVHQCVNVRVSTRRRVFGEVNGSFAWLVYICQLHSTQIYSKLPRQSSYFVWQWITEVYFPAYLIPGIWYHSKTILSSLLALTFNVVEPWSQWLGDQQPQWYWNTNTSLP